MQPLVFARLALVVGLCVPSLAYGQGAAVYQSGNSVPNHPAKFVTQGRISDAGGLLGDAAGVGLAPFSATDNNAIGICSNTGPTGAAYDGLCFGHDAAGNGLIAVDSYGHLGKALKIRLNGTTYDFPGGGAGTGNVLGPTPASAVNEVVVWNGGYTQRVGPPALFTGNQSVGSAADSFQLSLKNQTSSDADALYIWSCALYVCGNPGAKGNFDVQRIIHVVPPSGNTTETQNGLGIYYINEQGRAGPPYSSFPATNGINVTGICDADGAGCWGGNSIIADNRGTSVAVTKQPRFMYGWESDFQISSPNTSVGGYLTGGSSVSQPATANGFSCLFLDGGNQGSKAKWTTCFGSQHGSTVTFADIGTMSLTANSSSAQVNMYFRDATNNLQNVTFAATPGGVGFNVTGSNPVASSLVIPAGAVFAAGDGGGTRISNRVASQGNGTVLGFGSDTGWTEVRLGNTTGQTTLFGSVVLNAPPTSGTATGSVCVDAANKIFKKTSAGPCL